MPKHKQISIVLADWRPQRYFSTELCGEKKNLEVHEQEQSLDD